MGKLKMSRGGIKALNPSPKRGKKLKFGKRKTIHKKVKW